MEREKKYTKIWCGVALQKEGDTVASLTQRYQDAAAQLVEMAAEGVHFMSQPLDSCHTMMTTSNPEAAKKYGMEEYSEGMYKNEERVAEIELTRDWPHRRYVLWWNMSGLPFGVVDFDRILSAYHESWEELVDMKEDGVWVDDVERIEGNTLLLLVTDDPDIAIEYNFDVDKDTEAWEEFEEGQLEEDEEDGEDEEDEEGFRAQRGPLN